MKSQSDSLLNVAYGILEDIRMAYPEYRGVDRDKARLTLLVEKRGLGVFTLDLPERDAQLTVALASGFLDPKGTLVYSKEYRVPRLYAGLYMKIFSRDLCLKDDADVNAVAFLRQLLCLGKKTEIPCSKKRELLAIKEYFDVEQSLLKPSLQWGHDSLGHADDGLSLHLRDFMAADLPLFPEHNCGDKNRIKLLLDRCQRVADFVSEGLGTFDLRQDSTCRQDEHRQLGFRHGPGAVAERSGRYFDKFRFSNWSDKLQVLFPFEEFGKMPMDPRIRPRNHECPAVLHCVPKTAKGPRIIAAEPSEHMYAQKALDAVLMDKINHSYLGWFINLKKQELSQQLVLQASLDQSLATIDLSSASDRLSLALLERIFRKNRGFLDYVHAGRTRTLVCRKTGERVLLKKFASQGTAITFPLQTLVFLIMSLAIALDGPPTLDNLKKLRGKVRVYGDDIIVPVDGYAAIVSLFSTCQLKVNERKSFASGNFRESCGMDAFKGYDVTPVKPKTTIADSPAAGQAVIDTINNLFFKGYWNGSIKLENRQPSHILKGYGLVGPASGATGYGSYSFHAYSKRYVESLDRATRVSASHRSASPGLALSDYGLRLLDELRSWTGRIPRVYRPRYRFNYRLQHMELRVASIKDASRYTPYSCGYSGLLHRQLCPSNPIAMSAVGLEGVPERPHHRKVMRWEALTSFI